MATPIRKPNTYKVVGAVKQDPNGEYITLNDYHAALECVLEHVNQTCKLQDTGLYFDPREWLPKR